MMVHATPSLGAPSRHDLFLSPHSDDVCFSLGHFACKRRKGSLLTVFPVSNYRTDPPGGEAFTTAGTTLRRLTEDSIFAASCGLYFETLEHCDAVIRKQHPFDARHAQQVSHEIEASLMRAVAGLAVGRIAQPRPWLFCPAGIGGHVDHLAVLLAVSRNLPTIAAAYRVAFYEDLHYASVARKREEGLRVLATILRGRKLARERLEVESDAAKASKMQLVELYASQLTPALRSIASFTPAVHEDPRPHEAVWVLQDIDQQPG